MEQEKLSQRTIVKQIMKISAEMYRMRNEGFYKEALELEDKGLLLHASLEHSGRKLLYRVLRAR